MTAHINAKAGDFAPTVIMPGDPLRAKIYCRKLSYGLPRSYQRA
ncbi:Purine nucleoside phosphorylase [Citrobacter freundii]|uniref:Purine nucleoside phosphorylase n=1 Tax=Citrobacter freundii TaxID=546 RepID=A0A7G2IHD2_CITFR|nr:Purine nucleoside phosphorylase [Citrobacter freundii]